MISSRLPDPVQLAPVDTTDTHAHLVKTLVWMTDVNDVIVYLSRSIAHLFELGNVLSVGMYTRFIHPEDRDERIKKLEEQMTHTQLIDYYFRIIAGWNPNAEVRIIHELDRTYDSFDRCEGAVMKGKQNKNN